MNGAEGQEHEEEFLDQFRVRLRECARAKGSDRKAAAEEALEEIMDHDDAGRRSEVSRFQATYKLKKIVLLPKDAHEAFFDKIRAMLNDMFADSSTVQNCCEQPGLENFPDGDLENGGFMRTVKEIEKEISKLPREDLAALRKWFADFDGEQWDRQFEGDVANGKLDKLADKAIKDFEEGRCTDL